MRNHMVTYSPEATFSALADPTRRAVLDLLRTGRQPAGQIAQAFPISRPAISKHLRLLRRAHLVHEHREGRNRFYRLNPEPLRAVDSWLEQYRSFWSTSLANLEGFCGNGVRAKRPRPPPRDLRAGDLTAQPNERELKRGIELQGCRHRARDNFKLNAKE